MELSKQLANQMRAVFDGDNWVSVDLKTMTKDIDWQQANQKIGTINSIVALVYHIHYYVKGVLDVLNGGPLAIRDKFSFDHPLINSEESWREFLNQVSYDAEIIAKKIESIPDAELDSDFDDGKYGTTYRNIRGLIDHSYYHLGQIPIIKKMIQETV